MLGHVVRFMSVKPALHDEWTQFSLSWERGVSHWLLICSTDNRCLNIASYMNLCSEIP